MLFASSLYGCHHSAAPETPEAPTQAPEAADHAPEPSTQAPEATASDSLPEASSAPAAGKRSACTTDQSCNRDPSVSALWGHCAKDRGVCECNAGFELHPGGYCQPVAR
jgi:hypothetical protein